ncbi:hypothetical protein LTR84_004472 [Exophiala bonariae]|uniref:Xylanolytic transcriptional activator regulatory domain-containing protein n=1 Tax=Exophiala bonariae TaxID=1690606 RepID=A0AAV9N560_9EURO|nr:hypothetical protein LTR84_004472 [Exophiala bonariae]
MLTVSTHHSALLPLENIVLPPDKTGIEGLDTQFGLLDGQDLLLQDWFDQNFYEALHETDTLWPLSGDGTTIEMPTLGDTVMDDLSSPQRDEDLRDNRHTVPMPVSRIPSPPNEASEEDRWPFTWDPRSRRILASKSIEITEDHPLQIGHRRRFDITNIKYDKVKRFWQLPTDHSMGQFSIEIPTLRTANILIGIFFTHFEPRMPVIHRPSLQNTDNLPDALIAAMIVIGAIYSRQRHSTRFAIVLLDMSRIAAQVTMEHDNSLMRDAMYIYAVGLICYVGLWCGNKRAFELAELSRAAIVNFCRRSHFTSASPSQQRRDSKTNQNAGRDIGVHWAKWIEQETKKRLCWVVYGIDCEAASLLHIPPTLSITEIVKLECPCDEEFWQASSARRWKRLLGLAPFPASRALSSALSPFLKVLYANDVKTYDRSSSTIKALTGLNSWSRLLVLQSLQLFVYKLSEDMSLTTSADLTDSENEEDEYGPRWNAPLSFQHSLGNSNPGSTNIDPPSTQNLPISDTVQVVSRRKAQLEELLSRWSSTCLSNPPSDITIYSTSRYFYNASGSHHFLAILSLNVQIVDLQDALGKSGSAEMVLALENLSRVYEHDMAQTTASVMHCKKIAESDICGSVSPVHVGGEHDSDPEVFITLFLGYVFLWTVAMTASSELKSRIITALSPATADGGQTKIAGVLQYALAIEDANLSTIVGIDNLPAPDQSSRSERSARPTVILRTGAEALSRLRPWGACLNLALLLHQRAKM